jgi:YbbR domain-containing protein
VVTDQYGEFGVWTAEWRHLKIQSAGWIHGDQIWYRMVNLHRAAHAVDNVATKANLQLLDQALDQLEREIDQQVTRLRDLLDRVLDFAQKVEHERAAAASLPDPKSAYDLEAERIANLVAQSEIGLDRLSVLYGLDRLPES